jgi:hypothetical protein
MTSVSVLATIAHLSRGFCSGLLAADVGGAERACDTSVPVIPIIGARKLTQLQDNLASFDLELSAEHLKALDEASAIELGFPYAIYNKAAVRATVHGGLRDQILA